MARKRIVYVVSHIHKSLSFEWVAKELKNDFDLSFVLLNPSSSYMEDFLISEHVEVKRIRYRGKRDFIAAFFRVFFFFLIKRPDVVHAHLFDAQLIGLTSAWLTSVNERIYTRHNSNYHHVYHPNAVRYDIWSNSMATKIISISQATDFSLLQLEKVPSSKVVKIPHGFDLNFFHTVPWFRTREILEKWKISNEHPIVGVVARHIEWKGIQYIVQAFEKFLAEYPSAQLVLANAVGPYSQRINELLKPIKNHVILIPFEEDIAALYSTFDIYIHTPIDSICEAFGQTYVEALAAGVPSVFTLSGIAAEFIENERNALVVDFKNTESIFLAIIRLWRDAQLRDLLIENGRNDIISHFDIRIMLNSLRTLYDN